ncbi:SPARC-related modular calcium-binding protein 1 isoform X2 [Neocloeon triangulifer]|uniref:SPARC-related modular calcium-binding protein 1 isoform X2 n=1 Tax=Neocloeon triangulifer TaxID=2078957 RepID=UPI00286EE679|nr:SPARC-related modular calcium-binding protein 1 isoform X2 [Neocloeon triangulifer]
MARSSPSPATLLAAFALMLLAVVVQAQPPSSMRPTPELIGDRDTPRCPSSCSPNRAGTPRKHVCGTDGKTYPSACHLRRHQCQNPAVNLRLNYRGKCRPNKGSGNSGPSHSSNTPCQEARKFHASKEPENKFLPKCDKDGHYLPMQCFKVYCWCVEPLSGTPIHNTYLENTKPDCSKTTAKKKQSTSGEHLQAPKPTRRPRPSRPPFGEIQHKPKPKKVCDGLDRLTFNKNLLNSLIVDMRHLSIAARTDDFGEIVMEKTNDPETQRRILELKFNLLDANKDGELEKKEYRSLRKFARTTVTPRRCSRSFIQRCDRNKDSKISRDEWLNCLGFKHPADIPLSGIDFETPVGSSEQDSSEGKGCLLERKSAQEFGSGNLYVPVCTDDGKFQRSQCYSNTGYCFCVDEEDGKMEAGSLVLNSEPQCDTRQPSTSGAIARSSEKCTEDKKKRFLREFKALMGAKVDFSSWSSTDSNGDETKYEKVIAASFFQSLDKNNDRVLDKREWKEFRKIVDERVSLRQCGRKFLRTCDRNEDGKVSHTEWESCLTVRKMPQSIAPFDGIAGTANLNRTGPNPLETLLIQ